MNLGRRTFQIPEDQQRQFQIFLVPLKSLSAMPWMTFLSGTTDSSSDSTRRFSVREYGVHSGWNSRDENCALQESVNQQKVGRSNNDEGYSKVFQACAMVNMQTKGLFLRITQNRECVLFLSSACRALLR